MGKPTLLEPGHLYNVPAEHKNDVPIHYIITWIKQRLPEFGGAIPTSLADRVLIIKSRTGSGKSTALPVHVFRILRNENTHSFQKYLGRSVICTQPRVLTAVTLAKDIGASTHYPDMILGQTVGYQTKPLTEKPNRGLIYATAGVLLAQLHTMTDDEIASRYAFMIIDEAHERALGIDLMLMYIKSMLERMLQRGSIGALRIPFVILTSATIDTHKYSTYFGIGKENIILVEGRQYGVETHWPLYNTNNYVKTACETALTIHKENIHDRPTEADILIFMPGMAEIRFLSMLLNNANMDLAKEKLPLMLILPIDSEAIAQENEAYLGLKAEIKNLWVKNPLTAKVEKPLRRVIVSTVVAETGLTIETLKYVIDPGWNRSVETYYPEWAGGLITRPAAQSRIEQRKGRVGRVFPGHFYPLYTKHVFEQIPAQQYPEIITEGPGAIFLSIVVETIKKNKEGVFKAEEIDMLDPPPTDALASAIERAIVAGLLTRGEKGLQLTQLGDIASRFSFLSIEEARMCFSGYFWQAAISDIATILAVVSVADKKLTNLLDSKQRNGAMLAEAVLAGIPPFLQNIDNAYTNIHLLLADDLLEGLFIFEGFQHAIVYFINNKVNNVAKHLREWCEKKMLKYSSMVQILARREDILNELAIVGLNPFHQWQNRLASANAETFLKRVCTLKQCMYEAYRLNCFCYDEHRLLYTGRNGIHFSYHDAVIKNPSCIVTPRIMLSPVSKQYMEWRIEPSFVSVLDGFVNVDINFLLPRQEIPNILGGVEDEEEEPPLPIQVFLHKYVKTHFHFSGKSFKELKMKPGQTIKFPETTLINMIPDIPKNVVQTYLEISVCHQYSFKRLIYCETFYTDMDDVQHENSVELIGLPMAAHHLTINDFNKLYHLLKPDGFLMVYDLHQSQEAFWLHSLQDALGHHTIRRDMDFHTIPEWETIFKECGFTPIFSKQPSEHELFIVFKK